MATVMPHTVPDIPGPLRLREQYPHFIHGEWRAPASGQWIDVEDPSCGRRISRCARGDASDVETAGGPRPNANGKAWGWADISIRGDQDAALGPGEIGEICLRPSVPHIFMQSYFNNPDATLKAWRNFWLHTGDLGYLDEDGYLYFVGRQAHWLRVNGENVSAYEVESVISDFPGIEEAIAVGVPAELGDDDVKVFLRVSAAEAFDPLSLIEWCLPRMAKFKVPRYVEIVEEFPRSATKREVERHKLASLGHDNAWDARKDSA